MDSMSNCVSKNGSEWYECVTLSQYKAIKSQGDKIEQSAYSRFGIMHSDVLKRAGPIII